MGGGKAATRPAAHDRWGATPRPMLLRRARARAGDVSRSRDMVKLEINGRQIEVREGATLLQAAGAAGVHVPTLCHHPRLPAHAVCRMCLVEVAGQECPQPACVTHAREGERVATNTAALQAFRRADGEWLMARSPTMPASTIHWAKAPGPRRSSAPLGCHGGHGAHRAASARRAGARCRVASAARRRPGPEDRSRSRPRQGGGVQRHRGGAAPAGRPELARGVRGHRGHGLRRRLPGRRRRARIPACRRCASGRPSPGIAWSRRRVPTTSPC